MYAQLMPGVDAKLCRHVVVHIKESVRAVIDVS